jgi:hypothetical protein
VSAIVINVDETPLAATRLLESVGGHGLALHAPTVSFDRILPDKSTDEGRQVLGGYRGTVHPAMGHGPSRAAAERFRESGAPQA